MFSGSESTDSQKYTKWAMNPATYQNAANDQVDWAALAQQWIIMKEAGPPPIPGDRKPEKPKPLDPEPQEGGEAEMEVETEKDDTISWNPSPEEAPPAPGAEAWTNWNPQSGQSWYSTNSWNPPAPTAVPPPPILSTSLAPIKTPLLPTPTTGFTGPPSDAANDNAVPYAGFNSAVPPPNKFNNSQPAFWTGMAVGKITHAEIKPHNKRYSKVNVPTKVTIISPATGAPIPPLVASTATPDDAAAPGLPTLDANKRKQLPAWIREGLEKMERDKQKQIEREKEKIAMDELTEKLKVEEQEKMEILKTTIKEKNILKKSRFDSDNENNSGAEEEEVVVRKKTASPPPAIPLTQDELILKVRKSMTEILLRVTNVMIKDSCKEELQRFMAKRRASDQLGSAPSGAMISHKLVKEAIGLSQQNALGLGAYGEESSTGDDTDQEDQRGGNQSDSDSKLRESIRKRQAAFSKIEREIEDRLADVERNKRGRSRSSSGTSRSSSRESKDKETQVEANSQETRTKQSNQKSSPKRKISIENRSSTDSSKTSQSRRRSTRSSSSSGSRRKSNNSSRSRSDSRDRETRSRRSYSKSPKRRSRSVSTNRSSKRERSVESYRRSERDKREDSYEGSRKRSRRSRSDSYYSKRSRRSRSRSRSSYSSRKSPKRSRHSSRRSRTRSRSRDKKYSSSKRSSHKSSRRSRSRSYNSPRRRSRSRSRSQKKSSRSRRSSSKSSRRRRSSRSSSRGKRSHRR